MDYVCRKIDIWASSVGPSISEIVLPLLCGEKIGRNLQFKIPGSARVSIELWKIALEHQLSVRWGFPPTSYAVESNTARDRMEIVFSADELLQGTWRIPRATVASEIHESFMDAVSKKLDSTAERLWDSVSRHTSGDIVHIPELSVRIDDIFGSFIHAQLLSNQIEARFNMLVNNRSVRYNFEIETHRSGAIYWTFRDFAITSNAPVFDSFK